LDFSNSQFAADFQPLQFAVGTARLADRLTAGLFYARPTDYRLELRPPEALESAVPFLQRQYATVGLGVAAEVTSQVRVGAEMEWRQAELQDDFSFYASSGHAHDWRFSAGVITAWRDWQFGLVARSSYLAHGEQSFEPALQATKLESQQTPAGSSQPEITSAASSSFSAEEPALLRLGLMTPPIAQRLRVSADAEFQNFDSNAPILRWQFYTGAAMRISSALEWGWGCFTFRKDYSAFVDGPVSEIFLTTGATVQIAALRLTASYMNGDLFNSDFAGQQFVNVALGCGIP